MSPDLLTLGGSVVKQNICLSGGGRTVFHSPVDVKSLIALAEVHSQINAHVPIREDYEWKVQPIAF